MFLMNFDAIFARREDMQNEEKKERKKERKGIIERKNLSIFWEFPMLTLICYLPVITCVSYANIASTTATKNYTMPITHLNDL